MRGRQDTIDGILLCNAVCTEQESLLLQLSRGSIMQLQPAWHAGIKIIKSLASLESPTSSPAHDVSVLIRHAASNQAGTGGDLLAGCATRGCRTCCFLVAPEHRDTFLAPQRTKWVIYFTFPILFGYGLARSPGFLEGLKDYVSASPADRFAHPARSCTLH